MLAQYFYIACFLLPLITPTVSSSSSEGNRNSVCDNKDTMRVCTKTKRYILYDVNPGEGFNLRRDIFTRVAPIVNNLNIEDASASWVLVLPPWGNVPHWKTHHPLELFSWKVFFDMKQLREYIPVLELDRYLEDYGLDNPIDMVYHLQHFPFNRSQPWEEKIEENAICIEPSEFTMQSDGKISGLYYSRRIFAKSATCVSLMGRGNTIKKFLLKTNFRSILIERAEVILWDQYGGPEWWKARESLTFAPYLYEAAERFMNEKALIKFKDSVDEFRKDDDGKPYLAVHLRRRDFLIGKQEYLPSVRGASEQIVKWLLQNQLHAVFVASDAGEEDMQMFKESIKSEFAKGKSGANAVTVLQYDCPDNLSEGQCAIVEQILCTWASFFVGTPESTFTLRIFEEREIKGADTKSTFNYLCPDDDSVLCKKPVVWQYVAQ